MSYASPEERRRERRRLAAQRWRANNPNKYRDARKRSYAKNKETNLDRSKKWRLNNSQKRKEYGRDYLATQKGRASHLCSAAKTRAKKRDWLFDLTAEEVFSLMMDECCTKTGIRFCYDKPQKGRKVHPLAPSIDRIDSGGIYTRTNVQIVCTFYNLMKGQMTDDELYLRCKQIVEWKEGMDLLK